MNSGAKSMPFDHIIVCACSVKSLKVLMSASCCTMGRWSDLNSLDQWIDFLVFFGDPALRPLAV